ncbi:MAG: helix-turn-helix domain-containing protein [Chloroflexota bacterium]|nr:helix-turn-helix domain-containing protein [Chloroflexota bacterium]
MPARVHVRDAASSARHETGPRLGSWIRATRQTQGISQRALAERSGLSRSYLCDIERGRGAQPSVATIDKLADALGATRSELMQAAGLIDSPAVPRESDAERRHLAVLRDLSESSQAAVMQFARFLHAEEQRWVQSPLLGEPADVVVEHRPIQGSPAGPVLFDLNGFATSKVVDAGGAADDARLE